MALVIANAMLYCTDMLLFGNDGWSLVMNDISIVKIRSYEWFINCQ